MRMILVATLALAPLMAKDNDPVKRLNEAAAVFSEIMAAPDKGIPRRHAGECPLHCHRSRSEDRGFRGWRQIRKRICVLPEQERPRLVGARHGPHRGRQRGLPDRRVETDLIMLVMNERGADKLLSSKFTLGAEGSVAAGPVGRTATAQTDAQMHAEILSWSRSQGLFAGLALEGATLRQDLDDNATLYGKKLENREIVTTAVRTPNAAAKLIAL